MGVRDKLLTAPEELRELYIEQWDEIVYAKRFTFGQQKPFQRYFEDGGFKATAAVEVVLRLALDEDGNRLFSNQDRDELIKNGDFHVINDIAAWIIGTPADDIVHHEKNSEGEASD